jgi:hypothetical protein
VPKYSARYSEGDEWTCFVVWEEVVDYDTSESREFGASLRENLPRNGISALLGKQDRAK